MARSDPVVSLRVPSAARRAAPPREDGELRPKLRLVVAKGRLAAELEQPFDLGPLQVTALTLVWPDIGFPVELSGGVRVFRHRRGVLESLELALPSVAGQRFAAQRLGRAMGAALAEIVLAPLEDGWLLGACSDQAALAAEVVLAPFDGDLRLIVANARGLGLGAPPQAVAAGLLHRLVKPWGRAVGGAVLIEGAAELVVRQLLPLAGMRVPATAGARWTTVCCDLNAVTLSASHDEVVASLSARASGALELATLVAVAEQALTRGSLELARREYLAALAAAPRHPEITRRLAELDVAVGGRSEAALSSLGEAHAPLDAGALGALLLEAVGDLDGAREAMRRGAETEPYGPLAALCWQQLARLADDPQQAAAALDEAVARAPALSETRWTRFEQHLAAGRLRDAQGDLEHLEAAAAGAHERHLVWRRAADQMLAARLAEQAVAAYERALRYAPDSVEAVAGLAAALGSLGHGRRALELYGRAAALAERAGRKAHHLSLQIGRLLVAEIDDRPAAIARARSVPAFVAESFEARLLEARWRAEIGDVAGAGEALGRLGEAVQTAKAMLVGSQPQSAPQAQPFAGLWGERMGERLPQPRYPSRHEARTAIAALLEEGAGIEEIDRGDLRAARRLLALAVELSPQRRTIQRAFRRVASQIDGVSAPVAAAGEADADAVTALREADADAVGAQRAKLVDSDELEGASDASAEQRVERLSERLRANPTDQQLVNELTALLLRLGRDHELLALLSARIDETTGAARQLMRRQRLVVIERLRRAAEQVGRHDEAALYRSMLADES